MRSAEVVVVTVPLEAVPHLPSGLLGEAAENVAVIDTGKTTTPRNATAGSPPSETACPRAAGASSASATESSRRSTAYAQDIPDKPRPAGHPERIALPVSGDDEAAKHVVRELIDELGFDTVDAVASTRPGASSPTPPRLRLAGGASKRSPKPWPRCPRSDRRHSGRKRRRGEPADRDGMLHPRGSPPTVARATPVSELGSRHANRLSSFSQPGIWASTSAASGGRRRQR